MGSNRAFSLVELLVVIAIVSLLVSMALPSMAAARDQARQLQCSSNLRQLCLGLTNYDYAYRALPPGTWNRYTPLNLSSHITLRNDYAIGKNIIQCPDQKWTASNDWTSNGNFGHTDYAYLAGFGNQDVPSNSGNNWTAPGWTDVTKEGWLLSNYDAQAMGYFPVVSFVRPSRWPAKKLAPSLQFVMLDIAFHNYTGAGAYHPNRANHPSRSQAAMPRGTNVLHADGHVEWHTLSIGESWDLYGTEIWWTPKGPRPTGAVLTTLP